MTLIQKQNGAPEKNLTAYFALLAGLTIPFWLWGEKPLPIPVRLPVSALSAMNPMIAAAILTYRQEGAAGVRKLFRRAVDAGKIRGKGWYVPVLLLNPAILLLSYGVMRAAKKPLPEPHVDWLMAPVLFAPFFLFAVGEELGWMGYAADPMQRRWGALKASLVLGLAWALFHLIPDVQNGRPAGWIFWQRLATVANRVLIVWLYNKTGRSVFAAVLYHAMNNLGWTLFPNNGSHYDPAVIGPITALAAGAAAAGWRAEGRKTAHRPPPAFP